jgi:hypothetical protein
MPLSHDELGAISREVEFCGEVAGEETSESSNGCEQIFFSPFWRAASNRAWVVFLCLTCSILSLPYRLINQSESGEYWWVAATIKQHEVKVYSHSEPPNSRLA